MDVFRGLRSVGETVAGLERRSIQLEQVLLRARARVLGVARILEREVRESRQSLLPGYRPRRSPSGRPIRSRSARIAPAHSNASVSSSSARTPSSARWSASAVVDDRRLKSITAGRHSALARPWCRPCSLESGCASEWHAPRPFWNATAPIIAAFIMPPRASRIVAVRDRALEVLRDELDARERDRVGHRVIALATVRLDAVRERVEAGRGGDAAPAWNASARDRGSPRLASRCGEKITVLRRCRAGVTTPERPTSLPVPAVVGMVMIGGRSAGCGARRRSRRRSCDERLGRGRASSDELADVQRRAAADGDHAVGAGARGKPRHAGVDVLLGRVAVDAVEDRRPRCRPLERAPARLRRRGRRRRRRVGDDQRARAAEAPDLVAVWPRHRRTRSRRKFQTRHATDDPDSSRGESSSRREGNAPASRAGPRSFR